MNQTYENSLTYLNSFIPDPSKKYPGAMGLERMKELLKRLGNPQESYPVILVGGTSGKGSTATMIASILSQTYTVGLHVKPHLVTERERIQINGNLITEEEFADLIEELRPTLESLKKEEWGRVSYFEILVAMMYLYFEKKKVDVAVVEVGLGGRLDGTNVANPVISVITSIGFDHVQVLGNTLKEIAQEKFGIIKKGAQVISGISQPDLIDDLKSKCRETQTSLSLLDDDFSTRIKEVSDKGSIFDYCDGATYLNIHLPVLGSHQIKNAALAIKAACIFSKKIGQIEIKNGLGDIKIPGRMEVIAISPLTILDGAHNEDKSRSTAKTIQDIFANKSVTSIVGIKKGKEAKDILEEIVKISDTIILAQFAIHFDLGDEISIDLDELSKILKSLKYPGKVIIEPSLPKALASAQESVGKDGMILITGSMYLVGVVKSLWPHLQKSQTF